jgi:hypothetical protein
MYRNRKINFLSLLLLFAVLLTACGGANPESDTIATAVAMTVAAQETGRAQATNTPRPTEAAPTSTPEAALTAQKPATFAPPTAPGPLGGGDNCIHAEWVSETVPDGTIMKPNETFWKTWTIKNTGTCTWDSSYKLVYDSGELMGGLTEYQLTDVVPPGDQLELSILLRTPATNGNYQGFWRILSPWGGTFGVGAADTSLWVQVNVNDSADPDFAVSNVSYKVIRDPAAGCATNVWYTVQATITTNGPAEVWYKWLQSDGNDSGDKKLVFKSATSITVEREWSMHLGVNPGTKWMQIVITAPGYSEYPQATFIYDCK